MIRSIVFLVFLTVACTATRLLKEENARRKLFMHEYQGQWIAGPWGECQVSGDSIMRWRQVRCSGRLSECYASGYKPNPAEVCTEISDICRNAGACLTVLMEKENQLKQIEEECSKTTEMLSGPKDEGYRGGQTKTISGKTCQKWTSQSPHEHARTPTNDDYSGKGLGDHNFCRNPDGEDTIWCYTTDSNSRWEYCDPIGNTRHTFSTDSNDLLFYGSSPVCDDDMDDHTADLICQEMGFDSAESHEKNQNTGTDLFKMDQINCDGKNSWDECTFSTVDDCSDGEGVKLICKEKSAYWVPGPWGKCRLFHDKFMRFRTAYCAPIGNDENCRQLQVAKPSLSESCSVYSLDNYSSAEVEKLDQAIESYNCVI